MGAVIRGLILAACGRGDRWGLGAQRGGGWLSRVSLGRGVPNPASGDGMEKKGQVQGTFIKELHQPVSLFSRNMEIEVSSASSFFVV